ncbi:PREDICTED: uncharacterized protein K02A2.6-like [Wasmannia auropunctata]|uniref:uncharacterized protein K02A2.6-like n=1 Tax=Wasmannia auropunctata TaxID=64793 RepID=UPI0005ED592B|nr:PREDICTED: uncharacterized protein K02A2.6-like [Wasmannia auropunctata]
MEKLFEKFLEMQMVRDEELRQFQQQQANLIRLLIERQLPAPDQNGVLYNAQSSADQKAKNLAESMVAFNYDPENNLTFEAWIDRYETVFNTDTADWQDSAKIRLMLQKFAQPDYQRFADSLLPQNPTDLTMEEAIKRLKRMFGHRETKFSLRHKCFGLKKESSEGYLLLFVSGLKDSLILEKLLTKVDAQHIQLEAAADDAARALIPKLKLDDLVNKAERLTSLKQDKSEVCETAKSSITGEVLSVKNFRRSKKKASSPNDSKPASKPPRPCFCCGEDHWARECPHKDKVCDRCKILGHKTGFCAEYFKYQCKRFNKKAVEELQSNVKQVTTATATNQRKFVAPRINGSKIRLQLDTASDYTFISYGNWCKLGKPKLNTSGINGSASGHPIELWGSFKYEMHLNNKVEDGVVHVTARLNLLGIDWIGKMGIWDVPISTVCNKISMDTLPNSLTAEVERKFPQLFSDGLGLCTKTKVSLTLKPNAKKIFRKARPVPFAAAAAIEEEIKRQQHLGVFTPISYSEFAAPIVAVKRKNGKTRICGNYSTGLNDVLEPNKSPFATPEQIFASLTGKRILSKIDLSDAFLQLELDDDAKKLLVVNTHVGLFQVNRMQSGIKTAPFSKN